MSIIQKIVAGGPGRATRLHTESNEMVALGELRHLGGIVARKTMTMLTGRRPDEPWWPMSAIPIVLSKLNSQSAVLEYGAGSSTIWLARHAGWVTSVEDNPAWHDRVQERLAHLGLQNATVKLATAESYYDSTWLGDLRFDLVVVDGSYRWKCVEAALPRLNEGGALYLDNADSDKDWDLYPDSSMQKVAQELMQAYCRVHAEARIVKLKSLINGELHAGEGWLLVTQPATSIPS